MKRFPRAGVLFARVGLALLLPFACFDASASDPDFARFVAAKQAQVRDFAQTLTNQVPSNVWSFFDAVRVDDWETATNLFTGLEQAGGGYAESAREESRC